MRYSGSELFVIDLDRTLIDTNKAVKNLIEACKLNNLDSTDLQTLDKKFRKEGNSYNAWNYVISFKNKQLENKIKASFLKQSQLNPIKFSDTDIFLNFLKHNKIPFMVLTIGDQKWQELKIKAAELDHIPHLIMKDKFKGRVIKSWRNLSGSYDLPIPITKTIIKSISLVDDKLYSFKGMPKNCRSFIINSPNDKSKLSEAETNSKNVIAIRSLSEITNYLNI